MRREGEKIVTAKYLGHLQIRRFVDNWQGFRAFPQYAPNLSCGFKVSRFAFTNLAQDMAAFQAKALPHD